MSTPATVVTNLVTEGDSGLDGALTAHQSRGSHIMESPDAARTIIAGVLSGGSSIETTANPEFLNAAASALVFWKERGENSTTSFENAPDPIKQIRQLMEGVIRNDGPPLEIRQSAVDALCDAAVRLKEPSLVAFLVNEKELPPSIRVEGSATILHLDDPSSRSSMSQPPPLIQTATDTLWELARKEPAEVGFLVPEAMQNRANDPKFMAQLIVSGYPKHIREDAQQRFLAMARKIDDIDPVTDSRAFSELVMAVRGVFQNSTIDLDFRQEVQAFIEKSGLVTDKREILALYYADKPFQISTMFVNELCSTIKVNSPEYLGRTRSSPDEHSRHVAKDVGSYELLKSAVAADEGAATTFVKNVFPDDAPRLLLDGRCAQPGDHLLDLLVTAGTTHESLKPIVKHILETAVGISSDQYDKEINAAIKWEYDSGKWQFRTQPTQTSGGLNFQHKNEPAVLVEAMKLLYTKSELQALEAKLGYGGVYQHKTQYNDAMTAFLSLLKAVPQGHTPPVSGKPINVDALNDLF